MLTGGLRSSTKFSWLVRSILPGSAQLHQLDRQPERLLSEEKENYGTGPVERIIDNQINVQRQYPAEQGRWQYIKRLGILREYIWHAEDRKTQLLLSLDEASQKIDDPSVSDNSSSPCSMHSSALS
jgi:hypothetical protein